ncbi:DUF4190 domain-containing protein [Kitasatospora sp. NBC_01250]|uniref:DUF4190 domain-containing protein n=1 Tax=unclassified Kitasatospora TaxID=2633591 RepID=UPI002E10C441|nr:MULTISPECIES: DUF4190 domain-containing protein [unclassified Kitasatospora]WSJ66615.1 DUF4190 domain-containing protein [Kitasatospora sp. NBC_01302]
MYTQEIDMPTVVPSPVRASERNGPAVAALVVGIVSMISSIVFVGGVFGLVGLVLGTVALARARRSGVGRGLAVTGLVTSFLAILVSVLLAFFAVWYADRTQKCYQPDSFRQYTQCVHQQLSGH